MTEKALLQDIKQEKEDKSGESFEDKETINAVF